MKESWQQMPSWKRSYQWMDERKYGRTEVTNELVKRKLPCVLNSEKTGDELMVVNVSALVWVVGGEDVFLLLKL